MNFAAIDFETANSKRSSICSVGVIIVREGQITDKIYKLVKPTPNEYDCWNISIHGIKPEDTEDADTFDVVWDEISEQVGDMPLVAHYAPFDKYAMRDALNAYDISMPENPFYCTYALSKKFIPGLMKYRLPNVLKHIGCKIDSHHDALCDANGVADILMHLIRSRECKSLEDLLYEYNDIVAKSKKARIKTEKSFIIPDFINNESLFFGEEVVITGTLNGILRHDALQQIIDHGGVVSDNVRTTTNYLVVAEGYQEGMSETGKIKRAKELISKGFDIEIIDGCDFLDMIR